MYSAARAQRPLVSLVVPVFNEEDSIVPFVEATAEALHGELVDLEILFVNDGSTDQTLGQLIAISAREPRVRAISLSRNFGKDAPLTAGLDHAAGDVVVPIDVDLQDPPTMIPRFLERWREGYDVVMGCGRVDPETPRRSVGVDLPGYASLLTAILLQPRHRAISHIDNSWQCSPPELTASVTPNGSGRRKPRRRYRARRYRLKARKTRMTNLMSSVTSETPKRYRKSTRKCLNFVRRSQMA